MEKGKISSMSPNEVLGLLEIPPAAHEFAALLQFGTSYELVDWLAKRLQHVSDLIAQEHKDREIIQKAMLEVIDPENNENYKESVDNRDYNQSTDNAMRKLKAQRIKCLLFTWCLSKCIGSSPELIERQKTWPKHAKERQWQPTTCIPSGRHQKR